MRLLDVNVLIALAWPTHVHHGAATDWFIAEHADGWATCSVTESGFVRVSSNHRVIKDARTPGEAAHVLREYCTLPGHAFLSDRVSLAQSADVIASAVYGSSTVTDAHLLLLARAHDGAVATFDRGMAELSERLGARVELIV